MSSEQKLNTNPEILLRKRKNADRLRLAKQDQARVKKEEQLRKRKLKKNRFIRIETVLAKKVASEKEKKRIQRAAKNSSKVKLIERSTENNEEDGQVWDASKPKLLLVIRVSSGTNSKIPPKAKSILSAIRLTHINLATFIKLNSTVLPLLKLVAPYVVIGTPSLITVRELLQKRAMVAGESKQNVLLTDNTLIEDKFGDLLGLICVEDLVHEIYSLTDNFKEVMNFIKPFNLNPPVNGWGPISKLRRIELNEQKEDINYRGDSPLTEVDIDEYVKTMN